MDAVQKWDKMIADVKHDISDRLPRAAEILETRLRDLCDKQGAPGYHSSPGKPPLRQTGLLANGIYAVARGDDTIAAWSLAPYATYVFKTRPAPELAFEQVVDDMIKILVEGTEDK